jgi:hypothetical protein
MKLGEQVMRMLDKAYEPDSLINRQVGRHDLTIQTDSQGRPLLLFIGRTDTKGRVRGERFSRTLQTDQAGNVVKDHWDNKGKTS